MNKETKLRIKVLGYAKGQLKITDGKTVKITTRQIIYNLVQAGKIEIAIPKCICVSKLRNKQGIITHYRVSDTNGNSRLIEKNKLKELIYNYMLECINLTLTQDNRLVVKGIPDDDGTQGKENKNNNILVEGNTVEKQINTTISNTPILPVVNHNKNSKYTDDQQDTWDIQNWSSNYSSQSAANNRYTKAILGMSYKELNDLIQKLSLRV